MSLAVRLIWLLLAALLTLVSGYLLNNIPEVRGLVGRRWGAITRLTLWVTLATAAVQELVDGEVEGGYQLTLVAMLAASAIASVYELWIMSRVIWLAKQGEKALGGHRERLLTLKARLLAEVRFRVQERLDYAVGEKSLLLAVPMVPVPSEVGRAERIRAQPGRIALLSRQVLSLLGKGQADALVVGDVLAAFNHDHVAQKLLILGAPGSGKTTTLLTLAKELLGQTEGTGQFPYIFELSAWKDEKQDLLSWMVAQLNYDYGIDAKVGEQWIRDRQLIPLLDGLDELSLNSLPACVTKINAFAASTQQPVVVCCRSEEYSAGSAKLTALKGALRLQRLSDVVIEQYLQAIGRRDIWQALQHRQG